MMHGMPKPLVKGWLSEGCVSWTYLDWSLFSVFSRARSRSETIDGSLNAPKRDSSFGRPVFGHARRVFRARLDLTTRLYRAALQTAYSCAVPVREGERAAQSTCINILRRVPRVNLEDGGKLLSICRRGKTYIFSHVPQNSFNLYEYRCSCVSSCRGPFDNAFSCVNKSD